MAGGNLNVRMSKALNTEVERIIEGMKKVDPNSNAFNIEMKMTCKLDPGWERKYSPQIKTVRIYQDFVNNLTDKFVIYLELLAEDAIELYDHRNELFCNINFTRFNPQSGLDYAEPPEFVKDYRCLLMDVEDLFKKISDWDINPPNKGQLDYQQRHLDVRVELISETLYDARKKRMNEVCRNTYIYDMLRYCVNKFGFSNAHIAPPDNETRYLNFFIPPGMEIRDIMSYMQTGDGMGVYSDGFCSYISSDMDCWFIFPRFGEPLSKQITTIYSLGKTNYEGMTRNDWQEGAVRHVLVNGEVIEQNWNSVGAENAYNAGNILLSGCFLDDYRKICHDDECKMFPMIYNTAAVPVDAIKEEETVNIQFRHSRGNIYKIMSEIGALRVTTVKCKWKMALPFAIHPRCLVNFMYDHRKGLLTLPCMAEKVDTVFRRSEQNREYPCFTGTADITLVSRNKPARAAGCL